MVKKHTVTSKDKAPSWMVDNYHLIEGYRVGFNSVKKIIKSLFIKHNELMNIWTHLLGAIFFFSFFIYAMANSAHSSNLYKEIKSDIASLQIKEKISKSYFNNILPIVDNLKNYKKNLSQMNFDRLRENLVEAIIHREKEYADIISNLRKVIEEKELVFFKTFEVNYHLMINQFEDMKRKVSHNLGKLAIGSYYHLHEHVKNVEKKLSPDYFVERIMTFLTFDLEIYPFIIFLGCAVFCLGASTIYHTFYVMSPLVNKILQRLDMSGITILIFGSTYAVLFYYFYCQPLLKLFYLIGISVACVVVFTISMMDFIHKPEWNVHKGLMYGGLGLLNVIPIGHLLIQSFFASPDNDYLPVNFTFLGLFLMAALYLGGLSIYINKFPEKYYPRIFDIWLNSHTIWHLFVFLATLTHMLTLMYLYNRRKEVPCMATF